ncbi:hypothetical protein WL76_10925 [Burkholderia ubonensis]|uniref:DUF475 domain-containing protein n=1 Tax=Burkholderia ubonensis TaxID=101571 RepID=A0A119NMR7_9BURK|nr:DUF475 domain-containing protein [Burkholderia ubonensis]AOJ73838.1 hypothetical protein WJ35_01185 [Burkholderia ubonensis]KWE56455.1 hypothetical protein WL76_10925 [Burkholderia ubonensis]KWE63701.1 hypothetical protein WL77_22245 [Burkholderia ubonensis]KWE74360.1 hypothetical protein WL79_14170 [Burkholderia ubonensis]KWK67889.1 hypothetical protein WM16_25745 [Burkholderia ubonensis]
MLKDFKIPLSLTVLALVVAYWLGGFKDMLIVAVLCVLEISLSLDNAVVNASVLKNWSEKWRNRFMVFGLPVAVFGMRLVFPLLIVAVIGHIGMWEALTLAIDAPDKYAAILTSAHHQVSAFGGAFLLMVFFKFMLDTGKDEHWIGIFEGPMRHLGRITALEVALTLAIVIIASLYVPSAEQVSFLLAGAFGVISFVIAHGIGDLIGGEDTGSRVVREGVAGFMYLEVLDSSFSFDGVIGAFALSNNIFLIALGLGVGAAYIREMTLVLLKKGTLAQYRYLEHGAFWAIGALAAIMFLGVKLEIPEVVTGLIGAATIGAAVWSSIIAQRKEDRATAGGK